MLGLALAWIAAPAQAAAPLALTPLNRVTAGLTWVGGPSPIGINGSFESRLTPVVAAEFGGFASPVPIAPGLGVSAAPGDDVFYLRHGIFGDLGFRIPHHPGLKFNWDLHFRVGSGVVWTAHVGPDLLVTDNTNYEVQPSIGALAGADLLFRFGSHAGFRVGGKAWGFDVVDQQNLATRLQVSPQADVDFLYQW